MELIAAVWFGSMEPYGHAVVLSDDMIVLCRCYGLENPKEVSDSSWSSSIHCRHPALAEPVGARDQGNEDRMLNQVGYPLMSDAVALWFTSPQK